MLLTLILTLKSKTEEDEKPKLYDKLDDFTFPIVNFPFISSNIPASSAYGLYISQLIRYSRAFAQYGDFLNIAQLLTQKHPGKATLLIGWSHRCKNYKSWSQSCWPLRNIHISNDNRSFTFYVDLFLSSITAKTFTELDCICE